MQHTEITTKSVNKSLENLTLKVSTVDNAYSLTMRFNRMVKPSENPEVKKIALEELRFAYEEAVKALEKHYS